MKILIPIVLAALTASLSAQTDYSSLQVPKQIQYQGRVATGTGAAWSGTEGYFMFAIFQGGTVLWNNWQGQPVGAGITNPATVISPGNSEVLTLPVHSGVFSVRLGDSTFSINTNKEIPPTVFFDSSNNSVRTSVKLAVWFSPDGEIFTRLSPDVDFTSVPFSIVSGIAEAMKERAVTTAMLADGAIIQSNLSPSLQFGFLPVGSITMWWGAKASIPMGWEICDGVSPVTAGAVLAGNKPNLVDRFPKGAIAGTVNTQAANVSGGTHTTNALEVSGTALNPSQGAVHSHGVNDPGHSHGVNAGGGGGSGTVLVADNRGGGPLAVPNWGVVGRATGVSIQDSVGGQPHSHTVPSHDNRPSFLEIFYIIRVK